MERLTIRVGNFRTCYKRKQGDGYSATSTNSIKMSEIQDVLDRLAAYEDTGLEPEEIDSVFINEVLEENRKYHQAEAEGRLVVLPNIKKYKTLYWLWGDMIMPVRYWGIIGGTTRARDGKFHVTCEMRTKKSRDFHKERRETHTVPAGKSRYFYADDIGKTVFLTRNEAEASLGKEATP